MVKIYHPPDLISNRPERYSTIFCVVLSISFWKISRKKGCMHIHSYVLWPNIIEIILRTFFDQWVILKSMNVISLGIVCIVDACHILRRNMYNSCRRMFIFRHSEPHQSDKIGFYTFWTALLDLFVKNNSTGEIFIFVQLSIVHRGCLCYLLN